MCPFAGLRYRERPSRLYGVVKRPMIDIEICNATTLEWYVVTDVLVDTGADLSLMPSFVGKRAVRAITDGRRSEINGVVPGTRLTVYIHNLKLRLNGHEIEVDNAFFEATGKVKPPVEQPASPPEGGLVK